MIRYEFARKENALPHLINGIVLICFSWGSLEASVFQPERDRLAQMLPLWEKSAQFSKEKRRELRILYSNLARLKAASSIGEEDLIVVDIAGFSVRLFERGRLVFQTKALVGQRQTPTRTFLAKVGGIVLNPSWLIPDEIAEREILPLAKQDPLFLEKSGIRPYGLFSGFTIFKQEPGPLNPLGVVKFSSHNPFNIIVHGTNEPELFVSDNRAVSHGCVRVEKPLQMALAVLEITQKGVWNEARLFQALKKGADYSIPLKRPIAIYFGYWTAHVDESHRLQFRKDIYGWD